MAFLGLLFYIFSFLVRPADWWGPMLGFPIDFIILTISCFFILVNFDKAHWEKIKELPHNKLFLILIISVLISNMIHGNINAAMDETLNFLKYLVIYFVILYTVQSYSKLKILVLIMISLIAFMGLQGIYQLENGVGWVGQPVYWGGRISWVGPFDGANILALMCVITVPFLLNFLLGPWRWGYKLFALIMGYYVMTGLFLANSRGGYLSFIVVTLLFFGLRFKKKAGIALAVMSVLVLIVFAPSRFGQIDDKEKSSRGRIDMWSEAMEMIRYNPAFGIGKGQFSKYTGSLLAHNAFLQNLGETGLIGGFVWLCLIYVTLKSLMLALKAEENKKSQSYLLALCFLISFCGFLVGLLFISAAFEMLYIWIAMCAVVSILSHSFYRLTRKDYIMVGVLEGVGVLVAYFGVSWYKAAFY